VQLWAKVALMTVASASLFLMLFVVRLAQSDRPSGVQIALEWLALASFLASLLLSWLLHRRWKRAAGRAASPGSAPPTHSSSSGPSF
jgi:hypothetical protein